MASGEQLSDAERPTKSDGRQYHIGLGPGEVATQVLLVGDPERAKLVADRFDQVRVTRTNREYVAYTGDYRGVPMTVLGTGMSTANMEIAIIELCACLSDEEVAEATMIRCGSTGGLQDGIELGDLVISQAAYRMEATSTSFVGEGYPAVAHPEVVMALAQAASSAGVRYHVGINATAASFYGAQGRSMPGFPPRRPDITEELARQGITNLEMEGSTLLTLASLRGFRAGMICAVYATRTEGEFISDELKHQAEANCVDAGLEALRRMPELHAQRAGQAIWHPGCLQD